MCGIGEDCISDGTGGDAGMDGGREKDDLGRMDDFYTLRGGHSLRGGDLTEIGSLL